MTSETIQGMWIGAELSALERLSVASFLKQGHEYHLYVYGDVRNVPPGAVVRDASEVLPSSMIFKYRQFDSYAGFSNFFRYKLLLERGGWWADADIVCLKPFDFAEAHVFASEPYEGADVVSSGVVKAPAGSAAMEYAWRVCEGKRREDLVWGETGPRLVGEAVRRFSLERFVKPHEVFCPVGYEQWESVLDAGRAWVFGETTRAVHFWNEMWRRAGRDKNARYDAGCLYERLKDEYL
ncbi:MAG TPA: glycosyltransferase [Pyrinomonadaceae bacterium]|nr:glycosyltransferase [Pyrinomonadaceae bacterium]